jgi:sodium/bile acid cotransporter 3/5
MVMVLKPLSSFLIVFIIIFATVTNLYLFKLFTSKILFVGFCLPFLGCVFAWLLAYCCNRSVADRLAISVETSVQNTGIAIFMLRFSLGQPEADLTTVVPVAVALMTPLPLLIWYGLRKCSFHTGARRELNQGSALKNVHEEDEKSAATLIDQTFA